MARLDHVALGLVGQPHAEIICADEDVTLARELRDHQLRFRRTAPARRYLLLLVTVPC